MRLFEGNINLMKKQWRNALFLLCCLLLSGCSKGIDYPNIEHMLLTVTDQFPNIYRLITALAYLMGIAFIFRGVYQLKVYGDLRTMMSVQTNFKATMMVFFAGTALLYAPTAFKKHDVIDFCDDFGGRSNELCAGYESVDIISFAGSFALCSINRYYLVY